MSQFRFKSKKTEEEEAKSELLKRLLEISDNYSEISKQVSQLSEEISENSKLISESSRKIAVLIRAKEIEEEINKNLTEKTLLELTEVKPRASVRRNEFLEVIVRLPQVKILPHETRIASFLLAILRTLPEKATSPQHFRDLVQIIWNDLSPKWKKEFTLVDCHNALSVIENQTDVLHCRETPKEKFYLFNQSSEFYLTIQP